jgi:hypothetical protein
MIKYPINTATQRLPQNRLSWQRVEMLEMLVPDCGIAIFDGEALRDWTNLKMDVSVAPLSKGTPVLSAAISS